MARRSPRHIHGSRVATRNTSGEGGDCTQSTFPCRRTPRVRLVAGSPTQSPSPASGTTMSENAIFAAEIAKQSTEAEEKTGTAASAQGQRMRRPEQPKCAPAQKPNKFFSARSAPRSALSAFSEEDIPALTVPRFIPGCDNSRASGQPRIARPARRHTSVGTPPRHERSLLPRHAARRHTSVGTPPHQRSIAAIKKRACGRRAIRATTQRDVPPD
jgi:hypothetical protein